MAMIEEYKSIISSLPEQYQDVSGVLYSMVLTTVSCTENHTIDDFEIPSETEFIDSFSSTAHNLNYSSLQKSFSSLLRISKLNVNVETSETVLIETDDKYNQNIILNQLFHEFHKKGYVTNEGKPSVNGLLTFYRQALIRRGLSLLVRQVTAIDRTNLKTFPLHSIESVNDRKIRESELLNFTSLSAYDFFLFRQLLLFDDMIKERVKPLPNFTNTAIRGDNEDGSVTRRRYYKQLSGFAFTQLFGNILITEPTIMSQYDKWTDELLYAFVWDNPPRRSLSHQWVPTISALTIQSIQNITEKKSNPPSRMNSARQEGRPQSQQGNEPNTQPGSAVTSRPTTGSRRRSGLSFEKYTQESIQLTPAGRSLICIKKFHSTNDVWLTGYTKCNSVFGLRRQFFLSQPQSRKRSITLNQSADYRKRSGGSTDSSQFNEGIFFCHTSDDVRITASPTNSTKPITKPDGFGVMSVNILTLSGISLTALSNGICRLTTTHSKQSKGFELLGDEISRYIGNGGIISRKLGNGYFRKETLVPDGSRILYRNHLALTSTLSKHSSTDHKLLTKLILEAPIPLWDFIYLSYSGRIYYFEKEDSLQESIDLNKGVTVTTWTDTAPSYSRLVDGETKSVVTTYDDGRIRIEHEFPDLYTSVKEIHFPDRTVIFTIKSMEMKKQERNVVFIQKEGLPTFEIDIDIDSTALKHSKGYQVPINKGGDQVRSRIAMNDGTAIIIKYDTKITATTNGSIRIVRRDRLSLLVTDDGQIQFKPIASWDKKSEELFKKDSIDICPELRFSSTISSPSKISFDARPSDDSSSISSMKKGKNTETTAPSVSMSPAKGNRKSSLETTMSPLKSPTSPNVESDSNTKETKYLFHLKSFVCQIEDYEYNRFEINMLKSPMQPTISLAGEVEGLKPTAVAENPIDPRIFVVRRDGTSTEIISVQDVDDIDKSAQLHPDYQKIITPALSQPSDLGSSNQFSYFLDRRPQYGNHDRLYSFEEIFSRREWLHIKTPATVNYVFVQNHIPYHTSNRQVTSRHSRSRRQIFLPKLLTSIIFTEKFPLSQDGYVKLNRSIEKWNQFCQIRIESIEKYAVIDPRSREELDEEAKINIRLKKAYKQKKQAQRKKEKELLSNNIAAGASPLLNVEGNLLYQPGAKLEGVDEDSEESVTYSSDEDEESSLQVDSEEMEINAAFYEFGVVVSSDKHNSSSQDLIESPTYQETSNTWNESNTQTQPHDVQLDMTAIPPTRFNNTPAYLPIQSIRQALIQILGKPVSNELINRELEFLGLSGTESIYLSEFKILFQRLNFILNPQANQDELPYLGSLSARKSLSSQDSSHTPLSGQNPYWKATSPVTGQTNLSASGGLSPLELHPWNWTPNRNIEQEQEQPTTDENEAGPATDVSRDSTMPAGSAVQAVRNKQKDGLV